MPSLQKSTEYKVRNHFLYFFFTIQQTIKIPEWTRQLKMTDMISLVNVSFKMLDGNFAYSISRNFGYTVHMCVWYIELKRKTIIKVIQLTLA